MNMKNNMPLIVVGGLALLTMLKKQPYTTVSLPPTTSVPVINSVPIALAAPATVDQGTTGISGQGKTTGTAYGYNVGQRILINFWDSGSDARQPVTITQIEQGGVFQDGSDAHFLVQNDQGRVKDFGWIQFQQRYPEVM